MDTSLDGEPSSPPSKSSMAIDRENCDVATPNKRPKIHSFSLNSGTNSGKETHCLAPEQKVGCEDVPNSSVAGKDASSSSDNLIAGDTREVWVDAPDDVLHKVFSFLNLIDLCRAAQVCRQWRHMSSSNDLCCYMNFENRRISEQQFRVMCRRYPNATGVNVYGTPAINLLGKNAFSLLRNLEILTLGKGDLFMPFFKELTDCQTLRILTINNAILVDGTRPLFICHDRLHDLRIMQCVMAQVNISCPKLDTLSMRHSNMPNAVLNCPLLRELDIAHCRQLTDAAIRSAVISCPLLESLDMTKCSTVGDETLRVIAISCVYIRSLVLSCCPNIALRHALPSMLTVLKLHRCERITIVSMAAIARSKMLEVLELDKCSSLTSLSLDLPRLQSIRLVNCSEFIELILSSSVLSSINVSDCPSLQIIDIRSHALKKLVLQKQEKLTMLALECHCLQEVDLSGCKLLTDSIFNVFSNGGGCPALRSLALDSCQSLTAVSLSSTSIRSLTLGGCRGITSLDLSCPYLEHVPLDGCDDLERALFSPVGLKSLNLGLFPKLNVLHVQASEMVSLELKGCGVLSEAFIDCPRLMSLDASFCSQLKEDCLFATTSCCPLIESLVLMCCPAVGLDGLSLRCLQNLTYLDLSHTFLVNLQPVLDSCFRLKVLKLQACKYLSETSLEPLYKCNALPALNELDLSYGTLCQSAIEELLACCGRLTHINLNGCVNMHDLDWGSQAEKQNQTSTSHGPYDSKLKNVQDDRLLQNLNCVACPNIKKVVIPPTARCFHLSSLNLSLSSNMKEVDISCCNLLILNLSNCGSLEVLNLDCPKLTTLFLQSSNISEEAVEAGIMQCNMLESFDIRFCPKISPSGLGRIRAKCPSLKRIFSSLAPGW
ncbi:hypothetical protein ACS0TY_022508 [Phlomoides rotata]